MMRRGRITGLAIATMTASGQIVLATALPGAASAAAVPATASQATASQATGSPVADPAALVDPFVGTGSGGDVVGQVDTFPGASLPFGMIQWSPDTPSRPDGGGYGYPDSSITGFSLTHLSGPGCAVSGDFPILPVTGALPADPGSATASFSHADETAHPGSYSVTAGGVRTDLAVTDRAGVARFTYPATTQARLVVKSADSANGGSAATFQAQGDQEITGSVTSGHFCGQPDSYTVYFAARFDRPFTASGTWGGASAAQVAVRPGGTSVAVRGKQDPLAKQYPSVDNSKKTGAGGNAGGGNASGGSGSGVVAGGYLTFDTTKDPAVGMRVAVSYVSTANALGNLNAEATTWNVGAVAAQATAAWNRQLSTIGIAGGGTARQREFYTALYHASLDPTLFSDANGQYPGFDGKVHQTPSGHAQYANFSGWDIYRSEVPLLATIDPRRAEDMATSLLNDAAQGGALPKWPVANGYTGVMNGDPADAMLADTYAFGAKNFDTSTALKDMVAGADGTSGTGQGWYTERPNAAAYISKGYVPNIGADSISPVPNGASETLEYALADFAISRLAQDLKQNQTADTFTSRSQNWANVFDAADGYIEPRNAQGAFPSGPPVTVAGFGQNGFQEGNAAQYTWMVPQNLKGLIGGIGGDQAAAQRLDDYFTQLNAGPSAPYAWQGNEPGFDVPWMYDSVGQPWKTQAVVEKIMSTLYSLTPGGEPGNDDLGAMSSWYVWAALGVYPQTPGVPMLVLGTPQFSQAVIHGAYGALTITTQNAGDPYVQGLSVDGTPTSHTYVDLATAHALDFTLGPDPSTTWGTGAQDAPPSFGAGPVRFPPSTRASLTVSPGQVRLAPGASTTVSVTADNTAGTSAATVNWTASAPSGSAGLAVTPANGTLTAAAGQTASTTVTITAAPGMTTGYYQVAFTSQAGNGAVIPAVDLLTTVAQPGQSIPTAYVSNYTDNTVTPVDTRTRTAGPPIGVGSGPDGMVVTGGDLFVANNNSNNVTVIDTATNTVVKTIPVGSIAADVAATPDGKTVWVTNFGDGTAQPIDVATLTAGTPVTVGTQPERDAISPDGTQLWIANQGDGTASEINLATDTVTRTVTVGAAPFGVAVTADSGHVYISNGGSNTVSVIDTSTGTVSQTIATGAGPQGIAMSPDGSTAYIADTGAGGVTPVTVASGTPGTFIPTGAAAYAVGFSPDGTTAWVVNTNANTVTPVTVATGTPGTPVTTGNVPDGVTVTG